MRIDMITLYLEFLVGPFSTSIPKRFIEKKLVQVFIPKPRDYSDDKQKSADDTQFRVAERAGELDAKRAIEQGSKLGAIL